MSKEDAPPPYTDATNGLFQASTKPSFCSNCGSKLASTLCSACGLYAATAPAPETIQTQPGIGFSPSTVTPMTYQPQHEFTGGPSTSGLEFYKIFDDRLIIDFEKVSCLPCQTVGIFDQNLRSCPDPLKQKGITDAMAKMDGRFDGSPKESTICPWMSNYLLFPWIHTTKFTLCTLLSNIIIPCIGLFAVFLW